MTDNSNRQAKLIELIELQVENRISTEQFAQLEQMIRQDAALRRLYREYIDLHGLLHWNTARSSVSASEPVVAAERPVTAASRTSQSKRRTRRRRTIAVASLIIAGLVAFVTLQPRQEETDNLTADGSTGNEAERQPQPGPDPKPDSNERTGVPRNPIRFVLSDNNTGQNAGQKGDGASGRPVQIVNTWDGVEETQPSESVDVSELDGSNAAIVGFINDQIQKRWAEHEIAPSPRAQASEWVRRVYLDVVGHIPTAEQVREFVSDQRPDKRAILVDELLDDEDYVRNWTTVWTNLLIGRSNPREVNRPALERFLREGFAHNRGWDETVSEFIAAEGSNAENGATNFLLAHVNNAALPATATTARLFLGQQIQCLQCHDHPFNDWHQSKFYSFHSFFQQMDVRYGSGVELVTEGEIGPSFFERRSGTMAVAWPAFEEHRLDVDSEGSEANLRRELARLMTEGESTQVARAFVNRIWEHFFGAAFTPIVDDMGPHALASHETLLEGLSRSFVRSGYDVKQLIRWICQSDSYNRSSRFGESNEVDDPSKGNMPLFSRVYVKPMTVEQLFDSVMIATRARETMGSDWDSVDRERRSLQRQFAVAFDTEDNDEANLFNGTVPQALLMMNGPLVTRALDSNKGTFLNRVIRSNAKPEEMIESLALAALSRQPTAHETEAVRQLIVDNSRTQNPEQAVSSGLQDLFWAYLNSNEFILIH